MKYKDLLKTHPGLFNNQDASIEVITDEAILGTWQAARKNALTEKGYPEEWADIGVVYEDPYIIVLRDLVKFASGQLGSYFRILNTADLKGGQATVILPLLDGKILLMRQFRHATRAWHWEIPRGFGEPDTSPEENVIKELQEEIEAKISNIVNLGPYHSNTGLEGAVIQLFLANLSAAGHPNQDEGIQSYHLFSVTEVEEMICGSEITDGFTIAAYTRAKLKGLI